ncbi:efflux RND transporter permease subunit [bacterium]|nr:efflux RND transporter permease subunit [bacterium]
MRSLIESAVRRRVTVIMTAIAVIAFGLVGYQRLPLELFPNIVYPTLTIQTDFPDSAPQEVESLITRPLEEAVGVLRGLLSIHSVSRSGVSEITLEFAWDSDMDLLSMEVRDKLDRLVLPEEAEDPIVLRYDPSLDPVMRLALTGPVELNELRRLGDRKLKQDFERIKGVAAAVIKGGFEDEVQIEVDQEQLAALSIPFERITQVVGISNINLPGGSLRGEQSQFLIRTMNEFDTVEEIGELIIWQQDDRSVRLKDVATVRMGVKEREYITRVNGRECVEISIYKEGDANTVSAARLVRATMAEWQRRLPEDYRLTLLFDQSHFIEQALNEVRNAAIIGGLLAVLVLFLFLGDFRSTLIIATSIPLSIIATFLVMYRLDISLNIMSLGGLTLGIGMLVDNSIVVLESIYRKKKIGLSLHRAALSGTLEVGPAVMASTLTTVAVFLPIVFVEGIAGQLFNDQAMTVTLSLLASLVVAITVIPMFSALGSDKGRDQSDQSGARKDASDRTASQMNSSDQTLSYMTLGWFSRWYDRILGRVLAHPVLTTGFGLCLFLCSLWALQFIGTELIPQLTEGEFFFEITMPEGTSIYATDKVVQQMENLAGHIQGIDHYYSTVGSRVVSGGLSLNTTGEHLGQVNFVMSDRSNERLEANSIQQLRQEYAELPDLTVQFGRPAYFSLKTPIELILFGENLEILRDYSLELAARLNAITGLVDVRSSLEAGNPELQVRFHRAKLASLGLDIGSLSDTLKNRVKGIVPTRFKEEDRQIDIRIRNMEADRGTLHDIGNLVLSGPDQQPIRLIQLAELNLERGPAEIHRLQQQRAAVISANLKGRNLGAVVRDIEALLQKHIPPSGITWELGGQNREMQVSFASLRFALFLAVFLVYLVMAATFESFLHPFIILFSIPLALIGVVIGLIATGTTISVIVLIGTIMLVGIVVNNAIVLIDAINRIRRSGRPKRESIIRACHIRLRPILMTTLSTVLGLIPMSLAWGEGAELRSPLGITVVSGLLLSTLLTLILIPAVYQMVPSRVTLATIEDNGPPGGNEEEVPR